MIVIIVLVSVDLVIVIVGTAIPDTRLLARLVPYRRQLTSTSVSSSSIHSTKPQY